MRAATPSSARTETTRRPGPAGAALALVLTLLVPSAAAAAAVPWSLDDARRRVAADLLATLRSPPDLNRIASLAYPLSTDYRRHGGAAMGRVLAEAARFLRGVKAQRLGCGELADLYVAGAALAAAGRLVRTDRAGVRLWRCRPSDRPSALLTVLIYACRFAQDAPPFPIGPALARVQEQQRRDGSFSARPGLAGFYVTSHAVLAVHDCGGDPDVLARGQDHLVRQLPALARAGSLDGLLEGLVFLRWMGVAVADEHRYLAYLARQVNADGGICFRVRRGCRSHWHATGLLLELGNLVEADDR